MEASGITPAPESTGITPPDQTLVGQTPEDVASFEPTALTPAEEEALKQAADELPREMFEPPPITGYRALSGEEIALVNAAKVWGDSLAQFLHELEQAPGIDQWWLSIGRTQLQLGFMSVVRAITRPTSF